MGRISKTVLMLKSWLLIITGRSYYHQEQQPGKLFHADTLLGYFNDLTAKTNWPGSVSEDGLPLIRREDGKLALFPTTIAQKSLGHYDAWLLGRDPWHLDQFMLLAGWLRNNQDARGGWPVWPLLGLSCASAYSAMSQGQAISVAARAYQVDRDPVWVELAEAAAGLMLMPVEKGGAARNTPEGLVLEEVPLDMPNTVLNGWLFAIYGLYDLKLAKDNKSPDIDWALSETIRALCAHLPRYDAGYWSYYDTSQNLASPFYHKLHMAQLHAVEKTFPEVSETVSFYREKFAWQWARKTFRARAVFRKGLQKLLKPPERILF